jgi:DNA-directed RNA polymerase subunit K/omega
MTDVREIARLELAQKKLPFIIQRPLPNGTFEYWRLSDLMIL